MTSFGLAAATTRRVFVPTLVRRASTPRYSVSRWANASYGPSMRSTVSHGSISSPSYRAETWSSPQSMLHSLRIAMASSMPRSEEHTSELQSRLHLVCRLLLEKKKATTELTPIYALAVHYEQNSNR